MIIVMLLYCCLLENNGGTSAELSLDELKALEEAALGIRLAARIVDTPCNEMNVDHFLKEVQAVGDLLNIKPTIIRGEELAVKGLGGIYGVGKAAKVPPALAVLSYTPQGAHTTVAWVGKGIVYDTGGLSIKGKVTQNRTCWFNLDTYNIYVDCIYLRSYLASILNKNG